MANFSKLSELLNTTDGMTVLRNNSAQDDGVDTVTGVDWFTFNGVVVSNLYVSGNSFVGFGSNTEHLKICRRDGKMWYLYRQEGVIGNTKFLKIRWQGYTYYSSTASTYALTWELFLFDDGGMYLNIISVPSNSSYLGTSQLICGSNTYSFTVSVSTPVGYSFLPDETNKFILSKEEYPVAVNHVSSGSIEFSTELIREIGSVIGSRIMWNEDLPDGTSLTVYSKLSSGDYAPCTNGGSLSGVKPSVNYSDETLFIKVEMSTSDPLLTPILSNLFVQLLATGDDHILVLSFDSGNTKSIQNAVGDISVAYDGSGTLRGFGGPVLAFEQTFTPNGLVAKNNPNDEEHVEISDVYATGVLLEVRYTNVYSENEHIEVSNISASGTLTRVDDI
ncbi:MAG: hypothetical protein IJZ39_07310 [Oscillospiraceae bacterium]|nr:hypothetical protein [Oscillospiraceae bacterium]